MTINEEFIRRLIEREPARCQECGGLPDKSCLCDPNQERRARNRLEYEQRPYSHRCANCGRQFKSLPVWSRDAARCTGCQSFQVEPMKKEPEQHEQPTLWAV